VYDTFFSKRPPYYDNTELIKVPLPTPEGPTTIRGLYFKGVGLNG
jgi:hypothetical protein